MGAKSTGSFGVVTNNDGHLLSYSRSTFAEGGPGTNPTAIVALSLTLTSDNFTNNNAMPLSVGNRAPGSAFSSPDLNWSLSGNEFTLTEYRLRCIDLDASNYIHWSVDDIVTSTVGIDSTTNVVASNWPGSPTINVTGGGGGAAFANGWEIAAPPSGTHRYQFTVTGYDSGGTLRVTSNNLVGTYTAA